MGLISKKVKVRWNSSNKKHYESLGYVYTKIGDELEVKVEDLTNGSTVKVKCTCDGDGCGKELIWKYQDYSKQVKEDGSTYCNICGINFALKGKASTKTFYDWCIENHRQDVLDRWDYELNNCLPKDITFSTPKKYYFKCDKHTEHKSELKQISSFTHGQEGSIRCNQCNSIAQYILDNFPNKELDKVWDYDKNIGVDPWEFYCGSNKKIWIKCQEKDYHGSYSITGYHFSKGVRCPFCSGNGGKVHPKDSLGQYVIDNYGEEFLHKIWSDKNDKTPFDFFINSNKKVWWRCCEEDHEDYLRKCSESFACEFRCPKCVKEMNNSVIEEKTKQYLKELGYNPLTEHKCSIRPINPKTKCPLPYDNEIILPNGKHLIIEVHGGQHYRSYFYKSVYKCSNEEAERMLKQRKLYDRYKKAYAEHYNYNYLELPYWSFIGKNKDLYKQMIDNKIKEILEKEEIA